MILHYDVTRAELDQHPFDPEQVYWCTDERFIAVDSILTKKREIISSTIELIATEAERRAILAPIPNKFYVVLDSGRVYWHTGSAWVKLGGNEVIYKGNICVSNGTFTLSDSRINAANSTGEFFPDLEVLDLVTNSSVSCGNGSATVNLATTTELDIPGVLIIYC